MDRFEELLNQALNTQTTDIHFEIKENQVTIQFRSINGFITISSNSSDLLLLRQLKYLAHIDLTNLSSPQTGSFSYIFLNREYHFRLAVLQTMYTESCVIRILNSTIVNNLKSSPTLSKHIFEQISNSRNGLILFSGATGSGKTTSMYTIMQLFSQLGKRIYCIEDPIEIYFENIVQIQVNKQKEFGYEQGIKQLLRHDPDIIVVGEIRDSQEAKMAIRSALTGHLVLSTVHAKSTSGALHRLLDLGVSKQDLLETVTLITNQELYTRKDFKGRICLYEIMDSSEMDYYFQNQNHSIHFKSLQTITEFAKRKGII